MDNCKEKIDLGHYWTLPNQVRKMRRLLEDYRGGENSVQVCNLRHPNNCDLSQQKMRDIGTFNIFLFYILFTNDLS